jgi:hypothetical protein
MTLLAFIAFLVAKPQPLTTDQLHQFSGEYHPTYHRLNISNFFDLVAVTLFCRFSTHTETFPCSQQLPTTLPSMTFEELLSPSSTPKCTVVRARLMLRSSHAPYTFTRRLAQVGEFSGFSFGGYCRRVDDSVVELFIVTRNTVSQNDLGTLWYLLNEWSVDKTNISYENNNTTHFQYLYDRFSVVQTDGEADSISARVKDIDDTGNNFSIVSCIH